MSKLCSYSHYEHVKMLVSLAKLLNNANKLERFSIMTKIMHILWNNLAYCGFVCNRRCFNQRTKQADKTS